jgi:hypothetical protein
VDQLLAALAGAALAAVISAFIAVLLHRRARLAADERLTSELEAAERRHREELDTNTAMQRVEHLRDARLAVEAVISKIEDSELYKVLPHYELWDKGFPSLDRTRVLIAAAKDHLRAVGSSDVLHLVELLEQQHRPLIQFRDSFDLFMAETGAVDYERRMKAIEWPDLHHAENALKRLQDAVNRDLPKLKESSQMLMNS